MASTQQVRAGHAVLTIAVSDPARSERFYSELFGFVRESGAGYQDDAVVLTSPPLANGFQTLVLSRHPARTPVHRLMLELDTPAEVIDRHILSRLLNIRGGEVTSRGHLVTVTIYDPDGHPIELHASRHPHAELLTMASAAPCPDTGRWGRYEGLDSGAQAVDEVGIVVALPATGIAP